MGHSRPIFLNFCFFYCSILQWEDKILQVPGFELQISGVGSTALPTEPQPLPNYILNIIKT